MDWLDAFGITLGTVAVACGIIFLPILFVNFIDHILDSVRRQKHPEYFEFYDTAISESFRIGGKLHAEKKRIEYYVTLYSKGYRDGECTAEQITKKMAQVTQWWINACDTYNQENENIKVLLKKADKYAKQHNLKWGIIYDT